MLNKTPFMEYDADILVLMDTDEKGTKYYQGHQHSPDIFCNKEKAKVWLVMLVHFMNAKRTRGEWGYQIFFVNDRCIQLKLPLNQIGVYADVDLFGVRAWPKA